MIVKNEVLYIEQAIRSVLKRADSIIYIVDDHCDDGTSEILHFLWQEYQERLIIKKNIFVGKVKAYQSIKDLPKCEFVLFLDGDDFYCDNWTNWQPDLCSDTVYYHNLNLYYQSKKSQILKNPNIEGMSHEKHLLDLVLLPKASWIIPSKLIYGYLDIPYGVKFEDFWFSVFTYLNKNRICHEKFSWYMYRQHEKQVFGRLNAGGKKIVNYRLERIMSSIDAVMKIYKKSRYRFEFQRSKHEILLQGNYVKIIKNLGWRELVLYFMKINLPGLLLFIKNLIRGNKK